MTGFLTRLCGAVCPCSKEGGRMDRAYVSEFTAFIDGYLAEHPEVVKDQWIGREIYWDKKVDFQALRQGEQEAVPEDGYGFHYTVWGRGKKHATDRK